MAAPDPALVVGALAGADVRFIVVGEPSEGLRLVVSRHPTNLQALGTALDRLGATLHEAEAQARGSRPRRVGDPLGTVRVAIGDGVVELLFGGPGRSLYADTLEVAVEREIGGTTVRWAATPALAAPAHRTGRALGARLTSLAEAVGRMVDRRHDGREDGDEGPAGNGDAAGDTGNGDAGNGDAGGDGGAGNGDAGGDAGPRPAAE